MSLLSLRSTFSPLTRSTFTLTRPLTTSTLLRTSSTYRSFTSISTSTSTATCSNKCVIYGRRSFSTEETSHSDFEPKRKTPATDDATATIKKDISTHPVFVYMKGTPSSPQCGFSRQVVKILDHLGVEYGSRNVLEDQQIRETIKQFSDWPTIPQVFVNGEFVGGCDIVTNMFNSGELKTTLEQVPKKKTSA